MRLAIDNGWKRIRTTVRGIHNKENETTKYGRRIAKYPFPVTRMLSSAINCVNDYVALQRAGECIQNARNIDKVLNVCRVYLFGENTSNEPFELIVNRIIRRN